MKRIWVFLFFLFMVQCGGPKGGGGVSVGTSLSYLLFRLDKDIFSYGSPSFFSLFSYPPSSPTQPVKVWREVTLLVEEIRVEFGDRCEGERLTKIKLSGRYTFSLTNYVISPTFPVLSLPSGVVICRVEIKGGEEKDLPFLKVEGELLDGRLFSLTSHKVQDFSLRTPQIFLGEGGKEILLRFPYPSWFLSLPVLDIPGGEVVINEVTNERILDIVEERLRTTSETREGRECRKRGEECVRELKEEKENNLNFNELDHNYKKGGEP